MIELPNPIYQLKSQNCQNYLISVTWFEWVIKLSHLIYQLKSLNCQNYLISVTQFEWVIQLSNPIYQLNSTNRQSYLNITVPLDSPLFPQTSISTSHFRI